MNNTIFFKRETKDFLILAFLISIPLGLILMIFSWKFIFLTLIAILFLLLQEETIWTSIKGSFNRK